MTRLLNYTKKLACKLQQTWETHVRQDILEQIAKASDEGDQHKLGNLQMHIMFMDHGKYKFGRDYHVVESGNDYAIKYTCNVSGMPKIHCVVNKDTGDVARYSTELVNEAFFPFNLLDKASRDTCMGVASYNEDYLS